MLNRKNEDYYLHFSRKDLQTLCKKRGLPANRSKSDLANLLASCTQENLRCLRSVPVGERLTWTRKDLLPISSLPEVHNGLQVRFAEKEQTGAYFTGDYGVSSYPGEDIRQQLLQTTKRNELESVLPAKSFNDEENFRGPICQHAGASFSQFGIQTDSTGSDHNVSMRTSCSKKNLALHGCGVAESMSQIQFKDVKAGASFPADIISASVNTSHVPCSSFEFHVRSEEGINLHVDLNSSPSDWVEKLKNNVCIFERVSCIKYQNSHEESALLGECNIQMKSSLLQTADNGQNAATLGLNNKGNSFKDSYQLDSVDASLVSAAEAPPTMDFEISKGVEEVQMLTSPKYDSIARNQIISSATSRDISDCKTGFGPGVLDGPMTKFGNHLVSNEISNGTVSFVTSDCVTKLGSEACVNSGSSDDCDPTILGLTFPGGSGVGSRDSQSEAATPSPFESHRIDGPVDWKNNSKTEQGESAISSQLNHDKGTKHVPSYSEVEERSSTASGVENTVCSIFKDFSAKASSRSDDMDSNGSSGKSQPMDSDGQSSFVRPDARILRSSKHISREVLPRRYVQLASRVSM